MKYYIMRGGIIINQYGDYATAEESSKAYPGSVILKDAVPENQYGAPIGGRLFPPDLDSIPDEDYIHKGVPLNEKKS